ncbi:ROK family protein [Lapillicoccus jejuensis]|uniref:Putative NBD/HSP70 family sugar kinase n=1 Tax=Lapillicoccus jejuensis TaxID=402171 RepID=A0A542DWX8_9MICO|nr:ROK family protein [Lapillicoccus jejuensis]TQJ07583.1 putative NBD/HSP70 family sugar kinase [Lapillicoccus jejuensis]
MAPDDRPSPAVLRGITDETVLRALLGAGRATRAGLAATTGLSKPTVADAVRRLAELGLVRDTGERTTGRGGVGTYYEVDDAVGSALAVTIAPEGVVALAVDVRGRVRGRGERAVERPAPAAAVRRRLTSAARAAVADPTGGSARLAVVSAADPVDRATGRLVHLPDAPFLVGDLDPVAALRPVVEGEVSVDNDVTWAARAEVAARRAAGRPGDHLAHLYLGEGLGAAVVADGEVRRGRDGLAGEVAHLVTTGPGGRAMPLVEVVGRLGLHRPGTTTVDLDAARAALRDARSRRALATALAGVVAALVAVADPGTVVLAGPWGADPRLQDAVRAAVGANARPVAVEGPVAAPGAAQEALVAAAVTALRDDLARRARA